MRLRRCDGWKEGENCTNRPLHSFLHLRIHFFSTISSAFSVFFASLWYCYFFSSFCLDSFSSSFFILSFLFLTFSLIPFFFVFFYCSFFSIFLVFSVFFIPLHFFYFLSSSSPFSILPSPPPSSSLPPLFVFFITSFVTPSTLPSSPSHSPRLLGLHLRLLRHRLLRYLFRLSTLVLLDFGRKSENPKSLSRFVILGDK